MKNKLDCHVAPLLAMTPLVVVIANEMKQSRKFEIPFNKLLCIGLVAAVLIITGGCKGKVHEENKNGAKIIPAVKCAAVETKDLKETLAFVGDITGEDEAVVYSKVPGKILEKKAREGDAVKKGDIIATVNRDEVGYTFEPAPVPSPLDGFVGRIYLDRGDNVTPSTPIARVVRIDTVRARIDVVERHVPLIITGQSAGVTVDAYPGEIFQGTVSTVSPALDKSTRTASVEIDIPNAGHRLKPGMFAKVSIVTGERKGVPVISKDSVLRAGDETFVFVVTDGTANKRHVILGIREDSVFEVKEGLTSGEDVVVRGQFNLEDGMKVKVEEAE